MGLSYTHFTIEYSHKIFIVNCSSTHTLNKRVVSASIQTILLLSTVSTEQEDISYGELPTPHEYQDLYIKAQQT